MALMELELAAKAANERATQAIVDAELNRLDDKNKAACEQSGDENGTSKGRPCCFLANYVKDQFEKLNM